MTEIEAVVLALAMTALILVLCLWIAPIFVCGWIAESQGKNVMKVAISAFLLGWIGGVLALVLLDQTEESYDDRAAESDRNARYDKVRNQRDREDAAVKSERVKRAYDELVLGKKKS